MKTKDIARQYGLDQVDFDYITMDPQHGASLSPSLGSTATVYDPYVICVTANGNAVVIEKE